MDLGTRENKGLAALGIARIVVGWTLIWAFFDKLFGLGFMTPPETGIVAGGSPTEYYLSCLVRGPFEGLYNGLAGNAALDFLLMFGLLTVGIGLMLGIASKLSTIGTVAMMILFSTLVVPPEDNPLVTFRVVYIFAVAAAYWLGGFEALGLEKKWKELGIVKRFPILERSDAIPSRIRNRRRPRRVSPVRRQHPADRVPGGP